MAKIEVQAAAADVSVVRSQRDELEARCTHFFLM
jgi:hypothetical protein